MEMKIVNGFNLHMESVLKKMEFFNLFCKK